MTTSSTLLPPNRPPPLTFKRLLLAYILIMLVPYVWSTTQGLEYRGIYVTIVTILNIAMFAALLAQYPLAGRIDQVTRYTGVDNGMLLHRKAGEIIGLFFLLHPILIVLPRVFEAPQLVLGDFWAAITTGEVSTGVFAWVIMTVWILSSMYRKKLGLSYEAWKLSLIHI